MQGRLSPKEPARLQSFPHGTWREEFGRAAELGFSAIEWLYDDGEPADNPLHSAVGRASAIELAQRTGVSVTTACLHYFLDGALWHADLSERRVAEEKLLLMLEYSAEIGVRHAIIPAMEGGSLQEPEARKRFSEAVGSLLERCDPACTLAIETDLAAVDLMTLLATTSSKLGVCFDIGNLTGLGFDLGSEFRLSQERIVEIHIKDRIRSGPSCLLGDGDTDLAAAAALVEDAQFLGPLVLETPVFSDWHASALHNITQASAAFTGASE